MGFLQSLWGVLGASGGGAPPPQDFCSAELPEMWSSFVDYLVDVAYTRECPGGAASATAAAAAAAPASSPGPTTTPTTTNSSTVPTRLPAARRLVAIGDLHGDLAKARRAFALAGLTDPKNGHAWAGGDAVAVQVGDQLDRGDQEIRLLYFLERLQREASAAGGALHVLNGNHETMNAGGNFRYATAGADDELRSWAAWRALGGRLAAPCGCSAGVPTPGSKRLEALAAPLLEPREPAAAPASCSSPSPSPSSGPGKAPAAALFAAAAAAVPAPVAIAAGSSAPAPDPDARAREVLRGPPAHPANGGGRAQQYNELRYAALSPGGPVATRFFAPHPAVLQVGTTLFVHGGVLPAHVEYGLERINRETEEWLRGDEKAGGSCGGGGGGSGGAGAGAAGAASAAAVPWFFPRRNGGGGGADSAAGTAAGAAAKSAGANAGGTAGAAAPPPPPGPPPPPPPAPPATQPPGFLRGGSAVVWARDYSMVDEARCDCATLEHVLRAAGARGPPASASPASPASPASSPAHRMVVGHTIQQGLGVNAACGGSVLRVDVGMSRGCGDGAPEVLEILGDGAVVRRLAEGRAPEVLHERRAERGREQEGGAEAVVVGGGGGRGGGVPEVAMA